MESTRLSNEGEVKSQGALVISLSLCPFRKPRFGPARVSFGLSGSGPCFGAQSTMDRSHSQLWVDLAQCPHLLTIYGFKPTQVDQINSWPSLN